ncbi:hypothetical protein CP973_39205 [Streptomyces albofaciens JCM 4342]|uniref:hypothetical protein n=1 Tax=Streptomyces albofaciens TaxID=66866 RepID=UPI001239C9CE|nr:hypothetical protein [Streptomyces albofaciens]KAA6215034.1 hypothetical protein CP973_39205 [Streptomyces albofaciens JCM 4342]
MLYLSTPSSPAIRQAMRDGRLGWMNTPRQGNRLPTDVTWAADNGRFGKGWPGLDRWLRWLDAHADRSSTCLFAVAPDVPMDARATLRESAPWLPHIRALGYRAAFAAQDGAESMALPWDDFDVLFLAGTTDWKLGQDARDLTAQALELGKGVHMGHVNSARRYRYARSLGCGSADGTFLAYAPDTNLRRLSAW